MSTERIHLFGAGGHAKVVIDALRAAHGDGVEVAVFDDDPARVGTAIAGVTVEPAASLAPGERFHVAIGTNAVRSRRFAEIAQDGARPLTIVHPKGSVSPSAAVGEGAFVAAFAVLGPDSTVGTGTIVNHGAIVDHDCVAGQFCHIAPRAVLGGGVTIGDRVMVGAGAVILPGLTLACDVVVGAGAVVTKSITRAGIFVGTPAREVNRG
ncbi:NeuD/PglB/VioB family sugar acetyltransferase [Shinella sp. BYT-45]|uniref:NeuD/PglB/VioB family sugar acetyltransferase n=1 Tax=Shinella sp. BYT-45 TaxID=3377377 RepID=UPI00398033A0